MDALTEPLYSGRSKWSTIKAHNVSHLQISCFIIFAASWFFLMWRFTSFIRVIIPTNIHSSPHTLECMGRICRDMEHAHTMRIAKCRAVFLNSSARLDAVSQIAGADISYFWCKHKLCTKICVSILTELAKWPSLLDRNDRTSQLMISFTFSSYSFAARGRVHFFVNLMSLLPHIPVFVWW